MQPEQRIRDVRETRNQIREKIQLFARGNVVRLYSANGISEQRGHNSQRLRQLGPRLSDLKIRLLLGRFGFLACPFF